MGRLISTANRLQAIAFWHDHLSVFTKQRRPSATALAAAIVAVAPGQSFNRHLLKEAAEALSTILAKQLDNPAAAFESWIGEYLVDKSPRLLIAADSREAVLATMRDRSRRAREATRSERTQFIKLAEGTLKLLRVYAKQANHRTLDQAIEALIRGSKTKRLTQSKPETSDLFGVPPAASIKRAATRKLSTKKKIIA